MENRQASLAVEIAAAPASFPHKVFRCLVAAVLAAGICAPRAWAAPAVSERDGPDYMEETDFSAQPEGHNASDAYAWEQEALEEWEAVCEGGSEALDASDASDASLDFNASLDEPPVDQPLEASVPADEPVVRFTNLEDLPLDENGEYLCAEDIPDNEIPIASLGDVVASEGASPNTPAPMAWSQGTLARSAGSTAVLGSQKRRAYEGVFRKPGKDPVKD